MSDAIRLGYRWNPETGALGDLVAFDLNKGHALTLAPTTSGKGVGMEIPTLLDQLNGASLLSLDPTGQNGATCAAALRAKGYDVLFVNPSGTHTELYPDMQSVGCNPMDAIDMDGPARLEETAASASAFNWSEKGDTFFPEGGQAMMMMMIGFVKWRDGDKANLSEVMRLLMEDEATDEDGKPRSGLRHTASLAMDCPHEFVRLLGGRFLGGEGASLKTLDALRQTAQTAAQSLLSDQIRPDLARSGVNFGDLTQRKMAVFVIPPQTSLEFSRVWMRLIIATAINQIYRKFGNVKRPTLMLLSEFPALNMPIIKDTLAQGNKYKLRVWMVAQNWGQLTDLSGRDGATNYFSNAGCVTAFAPHDHLTSQTLSEHTGDHWVPRANYNEDRDGNITVGTSLQRERPLALEHSEKNPGSEFARTLHGLLDQYARPDDRRLFPFLPKREVPAETPALTHAEAAE